MYEVCVSNLLGSKELCFTKFHTIVLLCCSKFRMIVLKAEQAAIMRRWKDEEREAKERMLVSDFFFFLDQKIFAALNGT